MSVIHLGTFGEAFGAVWQPLGRAKLRKSGPKSIPTFYHFLTSNVNDFWMVWESKKHGFGSRILGGTRFLARLGLG